MKFLKKLRQKNIARLDCIHGSVCKNFSELEWSACVAGECGELCNLIKKVRRGSKKLTKPVIKEIGKEIADIIVYLDILAACYDIDIERAVTDKFNEVSDRYQIGIKL